MSQSNTQINKILVAMPTHQVKEYCFQQWIDNVKNLTYPNYDILVVDNSPDDSYVKKWGKQIPMVHLAGTDQSPEMMGRRLCESMAVIQKHFLKGNYDYWMNIEADNIPPKDVIETMLKYSGGDADWVSHCYLADPKLPTLIQGIGCSLLSRRLMTDFDWSDKTIADSDPAIECWGWVQKKACYKTVELWYIMEVKHLKE